MKRSFNQTGIDNLVIDHEDKQAININHEPLIWSSSSSASPPPTSTASTNQLLNKLASSKITKSICRRADIYDINVDNDHFVINGVIGTDHQLSSFNKVAMPSKPVASSTSSAHILNKVATTEQSPKAVKGALSKLLGGCVASDVVAHEANRSGAPTIYGFEADNSSTSYLCRSSTSSRLLNKMATKLALSNQSKIRVQELGQYFSFKFTDNGGDGGGPNASVGIESPSSTTASSLNGPSMSESIIGVSSTSLRGEFCTQELAFERQEGLSMKNAHNKTREVELVASLFRASLFHERDRGPHSIRILLLSTESRYEPGDSEKSLMRVRAMDVIS
ncbi:hypothetical protein FNV43_RR20390 [Rhamnella rubrinervis]|uniref:Uncharacterized protein n=1 Tax=Rhamnella rubrinervis TaxID=2594499 RepID=A0A8K0GTC2_9ROSA|nr:hypothetical protein FNV43_RR20390 [Rhamnella rubrinervis]